MAAGQQKFNVYNSPYSPGCAISAELVIVTTVAELQNCSCKDKILLMKDEICSEQLMPKNFVFYNPPHHQKIYSLLEEKQPAAVITATSKNPQMTGALYPFPLIVDGDFAIPSLYCTDTLGDKLLRLEGEELELTMEAKRIPAKTNNVLASKNSDGEKKLVFCAHIDAYENSPGAIDNATGVAVLLLLAEMLKDIESGYDIEIIAFNGEDHYSVAGQMDYLKRYGAQLADVLLAVNIAGVGYRDGDTEFSFYECPQEMQDKISAVLNDHESLKEGEPWFGGDHMIFMQKGVSALALVSEKMPELLATVIHSEKDTPDMVEEAKLVEIARALCKLPETLS